MPRIHLEEGLYYIVARANYGGSLFNDDADCRQYLELLEKYKQQHQFKLFAYHLARNSVTLLIQTAPGITISDIMRDLSSNYTKYFNGRHTKRGHLFQGRFKDILIEKDDYLSELTRYIHFSPVIQQLAEKPENYKWSSCRLYLGLVKQYGLPLSVDAGEVLEKFSPDREQQVRLYKEFVESTNAVDMNIIKRKLQGTQILGSREFAARVKKKAKETARSQEPLPAASKYKVLVAAGSLTVLVLGIFTVSAYRANLRFRENIKQTLREKEGVFQARLAEQREIARKDLDEKYRADKVSYQAMSRRLEFERKKIEELNKKLRDL